MTQVAASRGEDLDDLRQRNVALTQEQERMQLDLKRAELEKQDLQKTLDTLQVSSDYFQKKYKAYQQELRTAQREQAATQDGVQKAHAQVAEQKKEVEGAR